MQAIEIPVAQASQVVGVSPLNMYNSFTHICLLQMTMKHKFTIWNDTATPKPLKPVLRRENIEADPCTIEKARPKSELVQRNLSEICQYNTPLRVVPQTTHARSS